MKFDLRLRAAKFVIACIAYTAKLKAQIWPHISSAQVRLHRISQAAMRMVQLRLRVIPRFGSRSTLLKACTFGSLALLAMVIVGGLRAVGEKSPEPPLRPALVSAQPLPQGWNRLPSHSAVSGTKATAKAAPAKQKTSTQKAGQKVGQKASQKVAKPQDTKSQAAKPQITHGGAPKSTPKAQQPKRPTATPSTPPPATPAVLTSTVALQALNAFMPRQEAAPADPSNYGIRYGTDIFGKPVANQPLIVLHETVGSADSAINTFQTAHSNEEIQVSYHSLIRRDGTIIYMVPPEKRAFGAGNSVFRGSKGAETVRTHKHFPPSVNNFAYHISLETPPGGANDYETHSGYSEEQYRSLAWLVAHTAIPDERITTHQAIDQSGSRIDPRSFDRQRLLSILHSLPRPYLN